MAPSPWIPKISPVNAGVISQSVFAAPGVPASTPPGIGIVEMHQFAPWRLSRGDVPLLNLSAMEALFEGSGKLFAVPQITLSCSTSAAFVRIRPSVLLLRLTLE